MRSPCLPLSVVQLKGKYCQKPNCPNGVVDTFKPGQLSGGHWIEYSSSKFRFYNITKKIHVQHFWFRFRFLFSKDSFFITSLWVLKLYWRCSKNRYFSWLPYKKSSFLTFLSWTFQFALICSAFSAFFSSSLVWSTYYLKSWVPTVMNSKKTHKLLAKWKDTHTVISPYWALKNWVSLILPSSIARNL